MKLLNLLCLSMVLLFTSCGSDEPLSTTIVGTWDFVSYEKTSCGDPSDSQALTTLDENGCVSIDGDTACNIFITFSTDFTAKEVFSDASGNGNNTEEFTYTVNDDNNTAELCETSTDCETLTFDGDNMTRTLFDDGCTVIVKYRKS